MKKIAIVGTVGLPACYGGFESLVDNITKHKSKSISYEVFCSSKSYPEKQKTCNDAKLIYIPLSANGIQSVPYDIWSLIKCLQTKPDVTLILGVSGCLFLPIYRLLSKSKIVTNIDGLEWKRDKWSGLAKRFLKFSEYLAVKYSDVIIADNQAIGDYVLSEYTKENEIIAYGGDHTVSQQKDCELGDFYFSLCRIEPENNVSLILEAFSKMDKKIKFIGNWDSSEFGRELKAKYKLFENIDIVDPIYDIDKLYDLRKSCIGYIHGHSAGGTNPSLVEIMHFSKPIYAFDCNFNQYTTESEARYFTTVEELTTLLEIDDTNLQESAHKMKEIAERRYTWDVVTKQYEDTYELEHNFVDDSSPEYEYQIDR
jgi:glycosyltransferase involved in cell wall biosynthesis